MTTLLICLGAWIALQGVAVLWVSLVARGLGVTHGEKQHPVSRNSFGSHLHA